jgi:FHS family L-fucose permease-like MFS transporter
VGIHNLPGFFKLFISGFISTLIFLLLVFINYIVFKIGKYKPEMTVTILAICAAVLVVVSMLTYGYFAMYAILAAGLFNSIMFPIIFTLAINGPGKHTGKGSGILCTAIAGSAIIPVIQGAFADNTGIHHAFFLPVLCYIYIAYYGMKGHIPKS